jgi:uncharacterized membrane protein SpoIIM required for sporulation
MNLESFLSEGSDTWSELERLLDRAGGRPQRLGADGVLELGHLYRAAAADLALARQRFAGDPMVDRLEPLVLRARLVLYGERTRTGALREFLLRGYWRDVRAHRRELAVSATAMFAPTLLFAIWTIKDPTAVLALVPSGFAAAASPHAHHLSVSSSLSGADPVMIPLHNILVTFFTFAAGLTFGLGTLLLLAYNGLTLGVLGGLTIQAGTFPVFVSYIVPHGLLELSCITVAGAAGLRLAHALIDPGVRPRAQALREDARGAVLMLLGTAPWLVPAGLTEGLVTPRDLPDGFALAIGCTLAGAYWSCMLLCGRDRPRAHASHHGPQERPSPHRRARAFARR